MKISQLDVADERPVDSSSNFLANSRSEKFQIGLPPFKNFSTLGT